VCKPSVSVVLLAGGIGQRFSSKQDGQPKQFTQIGGRSLISYSLIRLSRWLTDLSDSIGYTAGSFVVVTHSDFQNEIQSEIQRSVPDVADQLIITNGGATRHLSCVHGVQSIPVHDRDDVYLIHDAARPFVDVADLDQLVSLFAADYSLEVSSLVSSIHETLVEAESGILTKGLDRSKVYSVKTPQAMRASLRDRFLTEPDRPEYTDLLRWAEVQQIPARLVLSSELNMKVTTARDIAMIEPILEQFDEKNIFTDCNNKQ